MEWSLAENGVKWNRVGRSKGRIIRKVMEWGGGGGGEKNKKSQVRENGKNKNSCKEEGKDKKSCTRKVQL